MNPKIPLQSNNSDIAKADDLYDWCYILIDGEVTGPFAFEKPEAIQQRVIETKAQHPKHTRVTVFAFKGRPYLITKGPDPYMRVVDAVGGDKLDNPVKLVERFLPLFPQRPMAMEFDTEGTVGGYFPDADNDYTEATATLSAEAEAAKPKPPQDEEEQPKEDEEGMLKDE